MSEYTHDEARACQNICEESDAVEAEIEDAVYFDDLVWHVTALSARKRDIEYRLENKDLDVDRDFTFLPADMSIEFVYCLLCDERCKHTYFDNKVKCVNDDCCIREFDAMKACDEDD
jgi:hypothetical protein